MLVAEVGGRVVGHIGLYRKDGRLAYGAGLGMTVHDDFQGMGIGTTLTHAALDLADNWLNLKRVELTVFVDNLRAIGLYERCGFIIEGTLGAFV
jgi:putative acetyltransferase